MVNKDMLKPALMKSLIGNFQNVSMSNGKGLLLNASLTHVADFETSLRDFTIKFMANSKQDAADNFLVLKASTFKIEGDGTVGDSNKITLEAPLDELRAVYGVDKNCKIYGGYLKSCLYVREVTISVNDSVQIFFQSRFQKRLNKSP